MTQLAELEVVQDSYRGPLDVLLQMLHKRQLDITTVSLSMITGDFLEYVESVGEHNPSLLGEFLAVASRLVHMKSALIFPESLDDSGDDEDAEQLEEQLKYYEQIKKAAEELSSAAQNGEMLPRNTEQKPLLTVFTPISHEEMQRLSQIFAEVIAKVGEKTVKLGEEVIEREITIDERIDHIHRLMKKSGSVELIGALRSSRSRLEIVVSFLAILELLKQNILRFDGVSLWRVQAA